MNQLTFAPHPTTIRDAAHQYTTPIKDLPLSEQPIARLQHAGPLALSTAELLAILISATHLEDASHLLNAFDHLHGLSRATIHQLQALDGVGLATAARIKVAFELGRRLLTISPADRPQVRSPADAAQLLMAEMTALTKEHLRVILLDTKNHVIAAPTIYIGSLNTSLIRIGELFQPAITANAAAILVVHNHPSGDPTPSPEDVIVTRKIVEAGSLLDIEVLDHLVIGSSRFVSLKERGLGFP